MKLLFFLLCIPFVLTVKKICPGGADKCPDTSTCCQMQDEKSYGCCPLKDAECCSDHIHCCPTGYKCASGMCVTAENKTATVIKIHAPLRDDIVCPDGNFTCPEDTTCCKNPNGYACCPMENAVCCIDGYHCCPTGTTCNLAEGKCDGDLYVTQMYVSHKNPPSKLSHLVTSFGSLVCPDKESQCPDTSTCCKLPSGLWGCCPFPDATCCNDGLHCCPVGMTCDSTYQFCTQGPNNLTAKHKTHAKKIVRKENDQCPDKRSCGSFETCCKISDFAYGCCQYANATCCADRQHCCRTNEECDVAGGRCIPKKNLPFDLTNEI